MMAASVERRVDSPTNTPPGTATACTRDAVLTRSPATIPWPSAPRGRAARGAGGRVWRAGPGERRAALSAELEPWFVPVSTVRTGQGERGAAFAAELAIRRVVRSAGGAVHSRPPSTRWRIER